MHTAVQLEMGVVFFEQTKFFVKRGSFRTKRTMDE